MKHYIAMSLVVAASAHIGHHRKVCAQEPIAIGSRLEPFVDEYLIDELRNAELRLNAPIAREVAIVHDAPWEGNICCYHTVFQDGDLFRMYYRGAHYDETSRTLTHPELYCYAESRDGVHWTKPELGIYEFDGSKQNNIILMGAGSHNFAPFKDSNPACDPEARYKALASGNGGLIAFASPDAIHWKLMRNEPVIVEGAFDSQNLAFWDSVRERYVDFHRDFRNGIRDIKTCFSQNFIDWTDPDWIDYPDVPAEHLYTNAITPYPGAPHVFVGFPKRLVLDRNPARHRYAGCSDGVFMSSRDGHTFKRWREALVRPGQQVERWVNRNNMTAWGILVTESGPLGTPNELSIYSTENYYRGDAVRLRRYASRLDGFVSVNAKATGGELITKPITFDVVSSQPKGQQEVVDGPVTIDDSQPLIGSQSLNFREPCFLNLPGTKNLGSKVTLAVHVANVPPGHRRLFSAYNGGSTAPQEFYFDIGAGDAGLRFGYGEMEVVTSRESIGDLSDGKMHHLAATWNDGIVTLYADGKSVAKGGETGRGALEFELGDLRFGEDYPPTSLTNEPFIGMADDILVLRRALSPVEIEKGAKSGISTVIDTTSEHGVLLTAEKNEGPRLMNALTTGGTRDITLPTRGMVRGEVELVLNYATSAAGSVRCEILGENGTPLPGYSLAACDEIYGDEIDRAVSWAGQTEVKPLMGKTIRLRFVLSDADLYSIRFCSPSASPPR